MPITSRFGTAAKGEEVQLRFDLAGRPSILRLTDSVTNRFRGGGFQRAVASVNEQAAIAIQEGMVEELKKRVSKTGRDQGTRGGGLAESLLDPRNRAVTASSMAVGREKEWLDVSPAKRYWRQIEEGNPNVYRWTGLFTNDFASWHGPWSPGGTSSQSRARNARSGGSSSMSGRRMPEGYKHGRFPQFSRGASILVGPFPEYEYTRGGDRVFRRFPWRARYGKALAAVGLPLE